MNWRRLKYLLPSARRQAELDMRAELASLAAMAESGELGNLTLAAEDARAVWGWTWFTSLLADIRYGWRTFLRQPAFVLAAVLTLALGIGANTTIFSVINATILKPLAFPDSNRLVLVWELFGKGPNNENIVSAPNVWDFRSKTGGFEGIAIFDSSGRGYNLSGVGGEPEQVPGLRVSSNFFSLLKAKPMLGRSFLAEEEMPGRDHEVILSYGLWKRRYGGDASIVGQAIRMDGEPFTVVGVMPRDFSWQFWSGPRQLWVPVGYTKTDYGRGNNSFLSFARLKPGVTIAQARSELGALAANIAKQYPEDAGMGATVEPLEDYGLDGLRHMMVTLLAAVGFVLLIACVNVANLMLARGASRQKEFAIRRALGAAGWRIARQLLTESLLLAVLGGAAGVLLALWSTRLLFLLLGRDVQLPMRQVDAIPLDGHVLAFALLLSCLTGIIFGLIPALSVLRTSVNEPLKEGGRESTAGRGGRLRHVLVACEMALALVVLSGTGLMIKSATQLLGVDPGLNPKNVLTMQMSVPQEEIYTGPPGLPLFCRDMEEHVTAIPGVVSAGAVGHLPFEGNAGRGFQIEGRPAADPQNMPGGNYSVACPNYFRSMGIPILRGREFTNLDTLDSLGVIVINEAMARQYWLHENPIGKAIRLGGSDGPRLIIVGVVGDVHYQGLDTPVNSQFMRPYTQAGWPIMNIVVRTTYAPAAFIAPVKQAIKAFLPDRPVSDAEMMTDIVRNSTGSRRVPMLLLSAFSVVALFLAAVGLMGVVSYSVTQRSQEIGIRMAVGAQGASVFGLVLRGIMKWVLLGLALGIVGSIAIGRFLGALLYGVGPTDPVVLGSVSALLMAVALLAGFLPARRAANLDPIRILRHQ